MSAKKSTMLVVVLLGITSILMACDDDTGSTDEGQTASGCTREMLKENVDAYYSALAANDPSSLSLSSNLKYTENGELVEVGEGLWKTAGEAKLKVSALDTETCNSLTESVISSGDSDIVLGLRIQIEAQEITEIEAIVVRDTTDYWYFQESSLPDFISVTSQEDWETVLPEDQQSTREDLIHVVDRYFNDFPSGACNFHPDCMRYEDGRSPGGCMLMMGCSETDVESPMGMQTRFHVIDVETGIAVGFTMFLNASDFHMFRVIDGEVHAVHAVLATAPQPGWD